MSSDGSKKESVIFLSFELVRQFDYEKEPNHDGLRPHGLV